ncbi:MAG TPA: ATP-binding protein [Acholeplasmataceae bacterium]|nr:ATP-binding protein [Acholeplasmataceae bacterium]
MIINRNEYLNKLIESKHINLIKVITGVRRSGKSYLLDPLFTNHLKESGVDENHIIKVDLDQLRNHKYHDPYLLDEYIRSRIIDSNMYYIILDEIQLVSNFESLLNGYLNMNNVDIYVTGSNSRFLSSDIITEFRGRSHQVRIYPLSFKEFYETQKLNKNEAYQQYIRYGGMPLLISLKNDQEKSNYLKNLFELTYFKDIIERNNVERNDVLTSLTKIVASSIGSLTSARKLTNTYKSKGNKELSINTVISYLGYLEDSFLIEKVDRYDVKGKQYIESLNKYYFTDIGLRNAILNFRQQEENHIMENIVYLELVRRGYNIDVGIVEIREKDTRKQLEVDFVCNQHHKRYYVQVALNLDTREKTIQEIRPFVNIDDSFKKVIIVKDEILPWITEEGILVIGIIEFLLNPNSLDI